MSQTQAFPRGALLAGPRDDLKVLRVLSAPMALPMLERRLAQAGHRIDAARLKTLLTELQVAGLIELSGPETAPVFARTLHGARLCRATATSPPPA